MCYNPVYSIGLLLLCVPWPRHGHRQTVTDERLYELCNIDDIKLWRSVVYCDCWQWTSQLYSDECRALLYRYNSDSRRGFIRFHHARVPLYEQKQNHYCC